MRGEAITRARAASRPRCRAAAAFVALVLAGLPVAASGNEIGIEDGGPNAPAEDAARTPRQRVSSSS